MPFGGVVVNRLQQAPELDGELPEAAHGGARAGARRAASPPRRASWPRSPRATPPTSRTCARGSATRRSSIVPERQDDVHDVEGLAYVREHLWGRLEADRPLS